MPRFDWLRALDNFRVPYATSGKNVSKGNFVVKCPFCGHDDTGMHMSVAESGNGWRCFRRPDHRGKKPTRLLAALTGMTLDAAARLVGDDVYVPDDFMGAVQAALAPRLASPERPGLEMPKEFVRLDLEGRLKLRPAINYLKGRSFTDAQIESLTSRYGIRYATSGSYKGRIIFPVRSGEKLVSWTGRHVGDSTLRYKSLSPDEEKAANEGYDPALGPISDYLLFHNLISKFDGDTLYIVEGPFDALKLNVLGRKHGAIATCCFTSSPSPSQIDALYGLFPQFKRRVLLLDRGTLPTTLRVAQSFAGERLEIGKLPRGLKDPGELGPRTFEAMHHA